MIASHWGEFVLVHPTTSGKTNLWRGKVLVDTTINEVIYQGSLLKVGDFLYKLRISECNFDCSGLEKEINMLLTTLSYAQQVSSKIYYVNIWMHKVNM